MSRSSRPPLLPWSKSTWERWAAAPRMATGAIPRTKFLLLKAPASTLYEERFGDRNMFTVAMYGSRMMAKGLQVGCVVDCTALDLLAFEMPPDGKPVRYFHDTNDWDDFDMEYHSLLPQVDCEGKVADASTTVPPPSAVQKFFSICASHWKVRPNEHIALFDSRGGIGVAAFLAALYMCEKLRAPVHVALASVKEAMKPCGLADADLARELQRRYKGRREIKIESIPKWWFAVDDDDDDGDEEGGDGEDEKKRRKDADISIVIPPFHQMEGNGTKDDGSGAPAQKRPRSSDGGATAKKAVHPPIHGLQSQPLGSQRYERAISVLKQLTGRLCVSGVPTGSEIALSSAGELATRITHTNYKVTWRSRGRRGLLLILTEGVYFVENSPEGVGVAVSTIKMRFPHPADRSKTQHRTLLDGVLVIDREGPSKVPRYYATDILCHQGGALMSKPFGQRVKYLVDGVIMARKRDSGHDYGREPVKIRAIEYFDLGRLGFVLRDVARGVAHETEGIALVPLEGKYYVAEGATSGGDDVLIWKRGGDVSEDALLEHTSSLGEV